MVALGQQTQPGSYFPASQVPVELNSFRLHMLAIGNLGRRDPDYRKKHGKKKVATDLSGATVLIDGKAEKIFKHRQAPPYFNDLVLNDDLNKAAQFQAEYQASINTLTHTGPETYKGAPMTQFWERTKYFGYTSPMEGEGCGEGGPADCPECWMDGYTHFRPWFNVGSDVREVGLGIAKGVDGNWYATVISGLGPAEQAAAQAPEPAAPPEAAPEAPAPKAAPEAPAPEAAPQEAPAPQETPAPAGYFQLQTALLESENECLEGNQVAPGAQLGGAAFMATCQNSSGQMWKMVPARPGYFQLQTAFLESKNKCLEGNQVAFDDEAT
jgi:hypothetical protein